MKRARRSFMIVGCLLLVAGGVAGAHGTSQRLPPPPPELVAAARIPLLTGTVTDPAGRPIAGAAVNYRDLVRDLEGGTMTGPSGRYEKRASIQGGPDPSSRRIFGDGPHRIEVHAKGFRSWTSPVIVLVAGETRELDIRLQPNSAPAVPLSREKIRNHAVSSVLEAYKLAGRAANDLRVELLGDPVLLPDHRSLHRRTLRVTASRTSPDAIAAAAIRTGETFRESVLIVFRGEQGATTFSYNGSPGFLPIGEDEWRDASAALESFYATAVDVARGPERFYPYLAGDMRQVLRSSAPKRRLFLPLDAIDTELTQDELRRYAALIMDMASLNPWMELEGLDRRTDLPRISPASDPRGFLRALFATLEARRRTLKQLGAFESRHVELCAPFVRRLLGEGLVAKEDPRRDGMTHVPPTSSMYAAPIGGVPAALSPHFVLVNGQVRIVGFDMP